jgi:hypothetical protein
MEAAGPGTVFVLLRLKMLGRGGGEAIVEEEVLLSTDPLRSSFLSFRGDTVVSEGFEVGVGVAVFPELNPRTTFVALADVGVGARMDLAPPGTDVEAKLTEEDELAALPKDLYGSEEDVDTLIF